MYYMYQFSYVYMLNTLNCVVYLRGRGFAAIGVNRICRLQLRGTSLQPHYINTFSQPLRVEQPQPCSLSYHTLSSTHRSILQDG
jgi:hypothetical protein